jgi:hypothetical protein
MAKMGWQGLAWFLLLAAVAATAGAQQDQGEAARRAGGADASQWPLLLTTVGGADLDQVAGTGHATVAAGRGNVLGEFARHAARFAPGRARQQRLANAAFSIASLEGSKPRLPRRRVLGYVLPNPGGPARAPAPAPAPRLLAPAAGPSPAAAPDQAGGGQTGAASGVVTIKNTHGCLSRCESGYECVWQNVVTTDCGDGLGTSAAVLWYWNATDGTVRPTDSAASDGCLDACTSAVRCRPPASLSSHWVLAATRLLVAANGQATESVILKWLPGAVSFASSFAGTFPCADWRVCTPPHGRGLLSKIRRTSRTAPASSHSPATSTLSGADALGWPASDGRSMRAPAPSPRRTTCACRQATCDACQPNALCPQGGMARQRQL